MGNLPSAGAAGGTSNILSVAGTGLNTIGAYEGGQSQSQQYSYQSQVAANNAATERANASASLAAGSYQESISKLQTGEIVGKEKAAQGANGIDVGVGSAVDTRNSTQTVGAMDAALIHYNAARQAFGQQTQAANFQTQSQLDAQASKNAAQAGDLKALSTVLSGASSLSSKWNQFKLAGVGASAPDDGPGGTY